MVKIYEGFVILLCAFAAKCNLLEERVMFSNRNNLLRSSHWGSAEVTGLLRYDAVLTGKE
jgi:hypothetical protein